MMKKLVFSLLVMSLGFSQLQVGDTSPDFEAPICRLQRGPKSKHQ